MNFQRLILSLLSPSRNIIRYNSYVLFRETLSNCNSILNVGAARNTVLGAGFWFTIPQSAHLTTLDINPDSGADLICDVVNIPIPDNTFDLVVCQASAEHFVDIDQALIEIKRVTKTGGFLYFTVPFLQGYHADPYDFRRFTTQGFINIMELSCIHYGISSGPFSVISWILRDLFSFGYCGSLLYNLTRFLSSLVFVPISYFDYIFPHTRSFSRNASEYFYLFRNI